MGLEHFDLLVFYNFNDLNPFFQEKLFLKKLYINRLYPELTLLLIAASILLIVFNPDYTSLKTALKKTLTALQ